jgi:hypothetical protein
MEARGRPAAGSIRRHAPISFHSLDYNLTILFNCLLDFDQTHKHAFSQPNIFPICRQSLDKSYLYCNSSPTFDSFAMNIT